MRQHRLPSEVIPISYQLEIDPFVEAAKFLGRVKIKLKWSDTSDRITLNVHPNLQISNTSIKLIQLAPEEA